MKILKAKSKWFEASDLRLDAEYHLSDGPETMRLFKRKNIKTATLQSLTEPLYKGQIFKRCYVKDDQTGFPFISASGMIKTDVKTDQYLSKKYTAQIDQLLIGMNWILLSRSGTLGITVYTNKNFLGYAGSDDLIRVIPKHDIIFPGFLYAFLSSKYGYSLLTQCSYGGVVKHIEPHHIENIPIPLFNESIQREIHNKISKSAELKYSSAELLKECNQLFIKQFAPFRRDDVDKCKTISSKRLLKEARLNGFYYLSVGDRLESKIKKGKYSTLGDIVSGDIFTSGRGKRNYTKGKNGIPFLSNTNISSNNPFNLCNYLATKFVEKKTEIKDCYIMTGRVGQDTVGNVYYPIQTLVGSIASDNIIRIPIEDKALRLYTYSFLHSDVGYCLIKKRKTGVGQPFITEDMLSTIPIMELQNDEKLKIVQKTEMAVIQQNQALLLEMEAIASIEKEIESWQK